MRWKLWMATLLLPVLMFAGIESRADSLPVGHAVPWEQPVTFQDANLRQSNPQAVADVQAGLLTTASIAWWGFDAEDATEAFQSAIDSNATRLLVPNMGQDWVIQPVFLRSNLEIIFEDGVVVTAKPGSFKGVADNLFSARGAENLRLIGYGATLRMQKQDYASEAYQSPRSEWRHVLGLYGCVDVLVAGLVLRDSGGDGIYIGSGTWRRPGYGPFDQSLLRYCKNVHIKDVVCDNNRRQGISVIGAENLLIEGTHLLNTHGAPPQAGIDFEPNSHDNRLVNILMRDCVTENNTGSGIVFHFAHLNHEQSEPVSITFDHVRSRNNGRTGQSAIYFSSNLTRPTAPYGQITFYDNNDFDMAECRLGLPPDGSRAITLDTPENVKQAQEMLLHIDLLFNVPKP